MEQNFNDFRVYLDQQMLMEKLIKGKRKDLYKIVIGSVVSAGCKVM